MHWRFYTVSYKFIKDNKTDSCIWPKLVNDENDPCPLNVEDVHTFYNGKVSEVKISETFTTNYKINF